MSGSCARHTRQKLLDRGGRPQNGNARSAVQRRELSENVATAARRIGPNPHKKLPAQPLAAPRRQVGAHSPQIAQLASEHTPEADDAGKVQKDDCVARLEAEIERPSVVAIDDPLVRRQQLSNHHSPLFYRRWLPPSAPVERIEVNEREAGALGKPARDRALPGSTGADYEDALQ